MSGFARRRPAEVFVWKEEESLTMVVTSATGICAQESGRILSRVEETPAMPWRSLELR